MIASCGEALVDLVPDPVPGGGPMNVAVAAARLGAPAAFVGRVSTDEFGQIIWDHLVANGVDLRACERGPEPTARAIVEHVPQLVFRFEGAGTADTMLEVADLDRLGAGLHMLHGGTLGMFRGRTARVLATLAEQHDGLVSLDPNVRPQVIDDRDRWDHYHRRWLAVAGLYRASDEDVEWIWPGRSHGSCAAELLAGGVSVVIVTHGADGATVYLSDVSVHVESQPVHVVDTVGAGDSFVASVLVSLWNVRMKAGVSQLSDLDENDWHRIATRAVRAAAITCSRAGADPPTAAELDAP
ncbi:MAG: carbohydrate kinase [Acidimicrobiia bacterium]|nr:carbohydrate kinase [Acidimicrobiia bacterium]